MIVTIPSLLSSHHHQGPKQTNKKSQTLSTPPTALIPYALSALSKSLFVFFLSSLRLILACLPAFATAFGAASFPSSTTTISLLPFCPGSGSRSPSSGLVTTISGWDARDLARFLTPSLTSIPISTRIGERSSAKRSAAIDANGAPRRNGEYLVRRWGGRVAMWSLSRM